LSISSFWTVVGGGEEGCGAPFYDWGQECGIAQPIVVSGALLDFRPFWGTKNLFLRLPDGAMDFYRAQFAEVISGDKELAVYGVVYYRDAAMQNTGVEDTYETAFFWYFGHQGNWPRVGGYYVGDADLQRMT
jgi:hypothetical protein